MPIHTIPQGTFSAAFKLVEEFDSKRLGRLVILPDTFTPEAGSTISGIVFAGTHQKRPLQPVTLRRRTRECINNLLNPNPPTSNKRKTNQQVLDRETEALTDFDQHLKVIGGVCTKVHRARTYVRDLTAEHHKIEEVKLRENRQNIRRSAWPKGVRIHEARRGPDSKITTDFNRGNLAVSLTFRSGGMNAQNHFITDILTLAQPDMRFCVAAIDGKPQIVRDLSALKLR